MLATRIEKLQVSVIQLYLLRLLVRCVGRRCFVSWWIELPPLITARIAVVVVVAAFQSVMGFVVVVAVM